MYRRILFELTKIFFGGSRIRTSHRAAMFDRGDKTTVIKISEMINALRIDIFYYNLAETNFVVVSSPIVGSERG